MSDKNLDKRKAKVLVADDEPELRQTMALALADLNVDLTLARDGSEALARLREQPYDLVVADQNMPGATGTEVLAAAQEIKPSPPLFILVTAYGTIDMAVEAMRTGAFDFVKKPFELEELNNRILRALENLELTTENRNLRRSVESHYVFSEVIGSSKVLHDALDMAQRAAEQSSPVLLLGESGTGKDLIARAIHFRGPRARKPFIAINCGAIPENLIESEFFGHRKGAFTGAVANRRGCFEEVAGGTIFLDEIGEMPFDLQVKLLRVLEESKIRRVGENAEVPVDFRIIAATNRDLQEQVKQGRFRQDLFYRLNVLSITLPPLRQRREDVIPLAEHFLKKAREEMQSPVRRISEDALNVLQAYDYPGNVRELINILQRAILLCDQEVLEPRHLPPEFQKQERRPEIPEPESFDLKEETRRAQEAVERRLISKALSVADGNHKKAAKMLGISRGSLYNKLQKLSESES